VLGAEPGDEEDRSVSDDQTGMAVKGILRSEKRAETVQKSEFLDASVDRAIPKS
jgi:hypothetical protein